MESRIGLSARARSATLPRPRKPIYRIVCMLLQIRAGLLRKSVGHGWFPASKNAHLTGFALEYALVQLGASRIKASAPR